MIEKYPSILYKYRDWEDDYHKRMLTEDEIFFASSEDFNDPFDCAVPIRYDALKRTDKVEMIEDRLKKNFPHLDPEKRRQLTKLAIKEGFNPESRKEMYDHQKKSIAENF